MGVKIFQTGDIHIGMKFNSYPSSIKKNLYEARFDVLENMINKSNDLNSDIFVIAGDLFNNLKVNKRDIERTVNIINKFNGACVLVLPGNHDYDNGAIDLWNDFSRLHKENVIILKEERIYDLKDFGLDIAIYPAPCHSKHSNENNLSWIRENGREEGFNYHLGIAHGALEGLSPDIEGNYYYMSINELNSIPMDLWLIGHTHISYPREEEIKNHKIFNGGTPEPDGLDFKEKGSAWFIELSKEEIKAKKIYTGEYMFFDKEFTVETEEDLEGIKNWIKENEPKKMILRLNLKGSISKELYENLNTSYTELESIAFYTIIQDSELRIKINDEIIEKEFIKNSFPYIFLKSLSDDEEALQIAYDLLERK